MSRRAKACRSCGASSRRTPPTLPPRAAPANEAAGRTWLRSARGVARMPRHEQRLGVRSNGGWRGGPAGMASGGGVADEPAGGDPVGRACRPVRLASRGDHGRGRTSTSPSRPRKRRPRIGRGWSSWWRTRRRRSPIDLVRLDTAEPALRAAVAREGILLHERDQAGQATVNLAGGRRSRRRWPRTRATAAAVTRSSSISSCLRDLLEGAEAGPGGRGHPAATRRSSSEAFEAGWLSAEAPWLAMLEDRNLIARRREAERAPDIQYRQSWPSIRAQLRERDRCRRWITGRADRRHGRDAIGAGAVRRGCVRRVDAGPMATIGSAVPARVAARPPGAHRRRGVGLGRGGEDRADAEVVDQGKIDGGELGRVGDAEAEDGVGAERGPASGRRVSAWPTWSPSASAARATSRRLLTMSGTPAGPGCPSAAGRGRSARESGVSSSRSWTMVAPPATASATVRSSPRAAHMARSVTR